jgi:hypothetical protein
MLSMLALLGSCIEAGACTEIACESTSEVDYGGLIVNEPYALTISAVGPPVSVVCLSNDPEDEPLPEWLTCTASGFQLTGEMAESTTISVTVAPLSTGEAVISYALVTLIVDEVLRPNGPDCDPVCYRRRGSVPSGGEP